MLNELYSVVCLAFLQEEDVFGYGNIIIGIVIPKDSDEYVMKQHIL